MGGALKERYQIEDLVGQDDTGAVYCARDLETDRLVALRRFFPMGISGGGFLKEERRGFLKTIEALKGVRHDALRGVLDGGVDEVDGMPYLVMEWVEGRSLEETLQDGPLAAEQGVELAGKGLELLVLLESVFGEGAQWIEMEAGTVITGDAERQFTFWICPFQWLGVAERDGGIRGLAHLIEHAMGWSERVVPNAAAAGLGGWVAGAKGARWTIAEAFRELGRVRSFWTGEVAEEIKPPPPPASVTPRPPAGVARPFVRGVPSASGRGRGPWLVAGAAVAVSALAGIGWVIMAGRNDGESKVKVVQSTPPALAEPADLPRPSDGLTDQERINRQVRQVTEAMGMTVEVHQGTAVRKSRIFDPTDGPAMRNWVGETVELEGRLLRVRDSNSGKTRYLEFSDQRGKDVVCCRFSLRDHDDAGRLADLKKLEGKMLHFTGIVQIELGTGRIVLHLDHPGQIRVVGE